MIVGLRGEVYQDEVHLVITRRTEHRGNQTKRFFRFHNHRRWYVVDDKHGDACVLVSISWAVWLDRVFGWLVWQKGGVEYYKIVNNQHGKAEVEKMIGG